MKSKTRTRALSWLLSIALVLGLIPAMSLTAFADEITCPECGSTDVEQVYGSQYKCNECYEWFEYTPSGPPCPECGSTNTQQMSGNYYFCFDCYESFEYTDPSDTVEGDGSEYNPYMVGSCNALLNLCISFQDEWYEDYAPYVQLKADIDFNNFIMTLGYGINLNLDTYHINCGVMETRFEGGNFTVTGGTGSYISKLRIQEGATVNLNSGTLKDVTVDNSTLVINGGSITEDFETDNHAVVEMNNGTVCEIDMDDTSEFTMTGGTVENFIHLNGQSTSVISGGTIPGLTLYGSAACEVTGGTFTAVSTVVYGGTLTVSGGDFSGQYGGILNYGGAVEVTGGTFGSVANTSGTMALKGGNYEKRPSYYDIDEQTYLETYVPNGYNVEETDDYFTVVPVPVHTIIWKNWDGTTLETDPEVEEGETPTYDGEEPTKAEDETNTYTFSGWNPTVSAVTGEATYVAQFTATPKTPAEPTTTVSFTKVTDASQITAENIGTCTAEEAKAWILANWDDVNEGSIADIAFYSNTGELNVVWFFDGENEEVFSNYFDDYINTTSSISDLQEWFDSGDSVFICTPAATAYAGLKNTTTVVHFDGKDWYLIEDNSTSETEGTVTLLAKECVGASIFGGSSTYSGSTVEGVVNNYYTNSISTDAKTVVSGNGMFLLTTDQANAIKTANVDVLKCSQATGAESILWWLGSPYDPYNATCVYGDNGSIRNSGEYVERTLGVRPALQLDLSKVEFNSETKTFALPQPLVEYPLWLGGVQVTNKNASNIDGNNKASYDAETNTLTLNGYTNSGTARADIQSGVNNAAIYYNDNMFSPNPLTIQLAEGTTNS
ncbi:MAG: zinc ribbon domain-containing protein, partial [Clostridia bacterium]|nr:zinc ribbon domain-containing protein [Clostridia bacterium]